MQDRTPLPLGLLQRERRPDHVAGQLLAPVAVTGLDLNNIQELLAQVEGEDAR